MAVNLPEECTMENIKLFPINFLCLQTFKLPLSDDFAILQRKTPFGPIVNSGGLFTETNGQKLRISC